LFFTYASFNTYTLIWTFPDITNTTTFLFSRTHKKLLFFTFLFSEGAKEYCFPPFYFAEGTKKYCFRLFYFPDRFLHFYFVDKLFENRVKVPELATEFLRKMPAGITAFYKYFCPIFKNLYFFFIFSEGWLLFFYT